MEESTIVIPFAKAILECALLHSEEDAGTYEAFDWCHVEYDFSGLPRENFRKECDVCIHKMSVSPDETSIGGHIECCGKSFSWRLSAKTQEFSNYIQKKAFSSPIDYTLKSVNSRASFEDIEELGMLIDEVFSRALKSSSSRFYSAGMLFSTTAFCSAMLIVTLIQSNWFIAAVLAILVAAEIFLYRGFMQFRKDLHKEKWLSFKKGEQLNYGRLEKIIMERTERSLSVVDGGKHAQEV